MVRLPSCDDVDHEAFAFALGLKLRSPMKRAPSKSRLSNFLQSSLQPTPIGSPEKENVATTMRPLSAPTLASAAKLSSASQSSIKIPCSGVSGVSHSQWGPIAKRPNACTIQRVVELHATWRRSCYDRPSAKMKGFMHVLRAHYPVASKASLEAMVAQAAPEIEANDRSQWVARAKAQHADRLCAAFPRDSAELQQGCEDGGGVGAWSAGGVSVSDFLAAVNTADKSEQAAQLLPRGSGSRAASAFSASAMSAASSASALMLEELTTVLQAAAIGADAYGYDMGAIEPDTLIELCGSLPRVAAIFEAAIECGEKMIREKDRARLATMYRHPVSPASRCVKSPSVRGAGLRRPTLFDLRPAHEVEQLMPRHATSSRW